MMPARPPVATEQDTDIIHIRDLEIVCHVGIHDHEKATAQRVLITMEIHVPVRTENAHDEYNTVMCYEQLVRAIETLLQAAHTHLLETVAEKLAALCLRNRHVLRVMVQVEKPDIFPHVAGVGVRITRYQQQGA